MSTSYAEAQADADFEALYAEGVSAFRGGLSSRDCPHAYGTVKGDYWWKGFFDARDGRVKVSADQREQKAQKMPETTETISERLVQRYYGELRAGGGKVIPSEAAAIVGEAEGVDAETVMLAVANTMRARS